MATTLQQIAEYHQNLATEFLTYIEAWSNADQWYHDQLQFHLDAVSLLTDVILTGQVPPS